MAEFAAWGAEASPGRLIERDRRQDVQVGVNAMEALGRIAMQPDQARLMRARAALEEQKAREEELFQNLMKKVSMPEQELAGPPSPGMAGVAVAPLGILDQVDRAATALAGGGLINKAMKIGEMTSQIRQRQAAERAHMSTQAVNTLKFVRDASELQAQYFGQAQSAADWEQAGRMWEQQIRTPNPFAGVPYDANLVAGIEQRALSAKERATLAEKRLAQEGQETHRTERRKQLDVQNRIRQEQLEINRQRERRLEKQGGSGRVVGAPTESQKAEVERALKEEEPGLSATDRRTATATIASVARAKLVANRGLDWRTAYMQALNEEREAGSFLTSSVEIAGYRVPGTMGTRFIGGRKPETAMAIPRTVAGKVDTEGLVKGRYYMGANGQSRKYLGSGKWGDPERIGGARE